MSTTAKKIKCESPEEDPISGKMCVEAYGSTRFIYIPEMECDPHQTLLDTTEEDDILLETHEIGHGYPEIGTSSECCDEVISNVEVGNHKASTFLSEPKIEREWNDNESYNNAAMEMALSEGNEMAELYDDETENPEDSDEETIATFLTAAGQRLALYAVEDSDQVFAVAVYDESGEPPTNFQFLMKSDVERLIGEGAVRTVKKPSQMKRQLVTDQPPLIAEPIEQPLKETEPEFDDSWSQSESFATTNISQETKHSTPPKIFENIQTESSPLVDDQTNLNNSYVKVGNTFEKTALQSLDRKPDETVKCKKEPVETDMEIIERSTVNNLLMDEITDEELTFADIEESLQNFRKNESQSTETTSITWHEEPTESIQVTYDNGASNSSNSININEEAKRDEKIATAAVKTTAKVLRKSNLVRKSYLSSSLICRRDSNSNQQQEKTSLPVIDSLAKLDRIPEVTSPKAKRPRKQQLTSVNRGDSEIIIQPATFPSEDEEVPRKRTYRRKRKTVRTMRYKMRNSVTKRLERRSRRTSDSETRKQYELIEIDVDEKDRLAAKEKSIVEITLDENKEKGSSDKENEVIMLEDSDDDEVETSTSLSGSSSAVGSLECEHCFRNFRQKRALITHSRVCPKSSKAVERQKSSSRPSDYPKKQFVCKYCQEKFDVVVVLARHVKSMHSVRKRARTTEDSVGSSSSARARRERSESVEETDEGSDGSRTEMSSSSTKTKMRTRVKRILTRRRRRRKTGSADRPGWKGQKLHCSDCAKWFSSSALLASHSLQHATKKSEKQLRRCQTCKKILKSRLLYIRHIRMHSKVNKLQKRLYHTRQANADLATLRKRGRPRKL